jgi:hypothetical protein
LDFGDEHINKGLCVCGCCREVKKRIRLCCLRTEVEEEEERRPTRVKDEDEEAKMGEEKGKAYERERDDGGGD